MAQSFTATGTGALAKTEDGARRRVLVTGAAGNIGSYFAEHSHQNYELRLMVLESDDASKIEGFGEIVKGDLRKTSRMPRPLAAGMNGQVWNRLDAGAKLRLGLHSGLNVRFGGWCGR